ncbi:MAG: hypothetical protein BMS9Abin02_0892 [Anaerolineae bacterium]|jgi:hypothetical protein|nr:MAG: hypothetical protein BMS9Abin02_0892 [Anaerolineae bacterium]
MRMRILPILGLVTTLIGLTVVLYSMDSGGGVLFGYGLWGVVLGVLAIVTWAVVLLRSSDQ